MTIDLTCPFPSLFDADTETVILLFNGKHDSGREETQTLFKQAVGKMIIEAQGSPPTVTSLKFTV